MPELESHGPKESETKPDCYLEQYLKTHAKPPVNVEDLPTAEAIIDTIKSEAAKNRPLAIPIFALPDSDFGFVKKLSEHPNGDFTIFYRKIQTLPRFTSDSALLKRVAVGAEQFGYSGYYYYGESGPLADVAKKLGVLPRIKPDNFLSKADRNHPHSTDLIYNVLQVNHPELPKHTYWHEFIELSLPEEYYPETYAFVVTVNKKFLTTDKPYGNLSRLLRPFDA